MSRGAGGPPALPRRPFHADSHSQQAPEEALDLLAHALGKQSPETIILERDSGYDQGDELIADVARIRERVTESGSTRNPR